MSTQRKRYSAEFKARVALEAIKGHKTVNELASLYGVHPTQITHWKHQLQQEVPQIFAASRAKRAHDQDALQAQLYQLWGTPDDHLAAAARLCRESQTCGAAAAHHGLGDDLPQASTECPSSGASGVSVRAAWGADHAGESSREY
jgi:transposase-like protein